MNAARMKALEDGVTGIARKVLTSVPMAEKWTSRQVVSEMARTTGSVPDLRIVEGCLDTLAESGLLRESPRGQFQRVIHEADPIMRAIKPTLRTVDSCTLTVESSPLPPDAMTALGEAATLLRGIAGQLNALAGAIEDAALRMDEDVTSAKAQSQQLHQLKDLLKSIGV